MIKYLKDMQCINIERLILLKGKECGLNSEEIYLLSLISILSSTQSTMITPQLLMNYTTYSGKIINDTLESLLKKKWIFNQKGAIRLNRIFERLMESQEVIQDISVLDVFEEQFARPLSPMELEIIKEWVAQGLSEEMILKALKEAVKSNVLNLRYIDGILMNWKKNGIKERYIDDKTEKRVVAESHYAWWEDE